MEKEKGKQEDESGKLPINYFKLLIEYCTKNQLPPPKYSFEEKKAENGVFWSCTVKVGKGEYSSPPLKDKDQAELVAATVAFQTCTKCGSTTGHVTRSQELSLFFDYTYMDIQTKLQEQEKMSKYAAAIIGRQEEQYNELAEKMNKMQLEKEEQIEKLRKKEKESQILIEKLKLRVKELSE